MTIRIETYSRDCADAIRSMFDESEVTIELENDEHIEFGGLYESIVLFLEQQPWLALGGAAMGIVATEIIRDIYKMIKSIARVAFEKFKRGPGQRGIELYIVPEESHLKDASVGVPSGSIRLRLLLGDDDTNKFSQNDLNDAFKVYEQVICPVISYWQNRTQLDRVFVHGDFGPGEKSPNWKLLITSKDRSVYVEAKVLI